MKKLLFFLILFTAIVSFSRPVFALDCTSGECATCDRCGYCWQQPPAPTPPTIPQNWDSCRKCLYPNVGDVPATSNETLRLATDQKPFEDVAPTTVPGNFYTDIGCVKTGGFTKANSAGAVAQVVLNLIFSISGGIAFLYILFGAFQVATSQNNPEKLNYGKRLVVGAIVGLIFSLSAVFLVNLIATQILKIPGFGS